MRSKRLALLALLTLLLACATVRCQQGPGEEAEDLEEEPKGKGVHQPLGVARPSGTRALRACCASG